MEIHYRKADINWQSDTARMLMPLLYLVYSCGIIVMMAGMVYAVKLLLG